MLRVPLFTIARRAVLTSSKKVPSTVRIASARALSTKIYAVDAPDGEHDFQDREEHANGVGTIIGFAATTENAATIEAERAAGQAPPGVFAVDAPDGEHDLEELVCRWPLLCVRFRAVLFVVLNYSISLCFRRNTRKLSTTLLTMRLDSRMLRRSIECTKLEKPRSLQLMLLMGSMT
mmetsp:Transcript_41942/g.127176  ORF Transcript_41942/g.127176 Transcript_41942/m.127176 type:complete len:177 (+) Transcript_41942:155-685(+)